MSRLHSNGGGGVNGDGGGDVPESVRELLAGRALGDLSFEESDALDGDWGSERGIVVAMDAESLGLEGTAGLVYLALAAGARAENEHAGGVGAASDEMPADAMGRLRRLAETYIAARELEAGRGAEPVRHVARQTAWLAAKRTDASERRDPESRGPIIVGVGRRVDRRWTRVAPWLAMAAGVVIVAAAGLLAMRSVGRGPASGPTGGAGVADVLRDVRGRPDAMRLAWGEWSDEAVKAEVVGIKGEVVWSDQAQRGVLTFEGLPFIAGTSYQLWIIDEERGMEQRVSGAVFQGGRAPTVVEIDPGVRIGRAAAFAVTIEQAGGTWVSDMSRRVVIAAR